jgi:4-amino-4-deoxy-L-arabinose transferase-like glycosyltransferase
MDARKAVLGARSAPRGGGWLLGLLLGALFLIRLIDLDQPIVENYVGRQIPTAMAARNLERGSGFLRPRLDTAPFPNYFLIEPPLYEFGVVALRRITGLTLEEAGRALSAVAMTAAGWGLFELLRRRGCRRVALIAVGAFAVFPLTVRYGRAFQPDAAMLGASVAGLACWDRWESEGRRYWLVAGWLLLALGFAIKIIAAFLLIPLVFAVFRTRRTSRILMACSTLLPALLWYAWADHLVGEGGGSRASADNRAIWLGLVALGALARRETWEIIVRFLFLRAFTPLGAVLAMVGLFHRRAAADDGRRLWWAWGFSASITLAILAQKLHHEYYFLILAPVAAAGIGYALNDLANAGRVRGFGTVAVLMALCLVQARSTWRMPEEWQDLIAASQAVGTLTPADAWVIAPEVLLFQADRRGCRLEWTPSAVRRAAGEWGAEREVQDPLELVEYYRRRGARYFADLGDRQLDPRRMALHDGVRRRYKVIVDRPEVIIADLVVAEMNPHAN